MRSPCTSRMREAANPPSRACLTLLGSAPALEANTRASATASSVRAAMIWLAALQTWPVPGSPIRVTVLPINASIGSISAKTASVAPTMIVRVAFCAPISPPDTGASAYSWPSCLIRVTKSRVLIGEIVLMSMMIFDRGGFADSPCATPFSANSTFSTSGVSGNIRMMISACSATALGVGQASPPGTVSSAGMPLRELR